ncbi:prepilin-type N-terminal cleavage/methylation domain-containing protein [Legionella worsleiensis]|uniref:Tfp pilus assembly protein PilV n=1 Tax=Legionella worsleiensis TaxID=45076 RepID=A0A0W1AJC1_9GAMM|nr:prepilin-type N-terminal cleavage/methylation domain-containing protein [Legionella worsleiensis]KTD81326.1 hypothetical protein Lwor_0827 [Legionella worsleiensis]STY30754.1 Tfp pilus assembly protein PilV [Legionella worsleiensis]
MKSLQGFSLIEVLLSLMLVTTVALGLLEQHWNTRQYVNQLVLHTDALPLIDSISESFYVQEYTLPLLSAPYHLSSYQQAHCLNVRIEWYNGKEFIARKNTLREIV